VTACHWKQHLCAAARKCTPRTVCSGSPIFMPSGAFAPAS
jgi:hypothetical protein